MAGEHLQDVPFATLKSSIEISKQRFRSSSIKPSFIIFRETAWNLFKDEIKTKEAIPYSKKKQTTIIILITGLCI
ncbi:unnamed protein product [Rhizophagus irregularis]|nr:unnamed protein product [Rhizophagus irregularis]